MTDSNQTYKSQKLSKAWLIMTTLLIIGALLLGTYAYSTHLNFPIKNSIYAAFRLFTINVEVPSEMQLPITLEVARWLAGFVVISNIIATIWVLFKDKILIYLTRYAKGHYVIIGLTESAYFLAKDLVTKNHRVVIIEKNPAHSLLPELKSLGITMFIGDATNPMTLKQVALHKASHFIVFSNKDAVSVEITLIIIEYLTNRDILSIEKSIIGHIQLTSNDYDPILRNLLTSHATKLLSIKTFDTYELMANLLLDQHPLYKMADQRNEKQHVLLIGLGKLGESILLEAINRGHFYNREKLKITVVDQQAERLYSAFIAKRSQIHDACELQFHQVDVEGVEFQQLLSELKSEVTYAVVCLGNSTENYLAASKLINKGFQDIPIAVRLFHSQSLATLISLDATTYRHVFTFGDIQEVANEKYIINEENTRLARQLHAIYQKHNAADNWEDLDQFTMNSNLAQVNHMNTKLAAFGMEWAPRKDKREAVTKEEWNSLVLPNYEWLAEIEHDRWKAFHFVNGWTTMTEIRSDRKDKDTKEHMGLVDWNQLEAVTQVIKERFGTHADFKTYTRGHIHSLYDMLEETGCKVVKIE